MNRMGLALVLVAGFLTVAGCSSGTAPAATQQALAQGAPVATGPSPLGTSVPASSNVASTVRSPSSSPAAADIASYSLVPGPIYRPLAVDGVSESNFLRVVIGDVDGDRRADVVASAWDNTLHVLRQRPDGSLGAAEVFTSGMPGYTGSPEAVLADMDGNGVSDVVYTATSDVGGCCGPQAGMVGVLRWRGAGGWDNRLYSLHPLGAGEPFGRSLVTLDVDLDGKLDLVGGALERLWINAATGSIDWECGTGFDHCTRLRIAYGNGWGGFSRVETVKLSSPRQMLGMVAIDINTDGRRDVVITSWDGYANTRHVEALFQSGYGTLLPRAPLFQDADFGSSGEDVFGDVSGDGVVDSVTYTRVRTGTLSGTWSAPYWLPAWGSWHSPTTILADLNGDRKLDLVNQQLQAIAGSFYRRPVLTLYLQQGGQLRASPNVIETTHHYSTNRNGLAVGDINGDACNDVVVAGSVDGVAVFYGSGCVPYVPTLPVEPGPEPAS